MQRVPIIHFFGWPIAEEYLVVVTTVSDGYALFYVVQSKLSFFFIYEGFCICWISDGPVKLFIFMISLFTSVQVQRFFL